MREYRTSVKPGEKYNRLTVIGYTHVKRKYKHFDCKCDCGNIVNVRGSQLKNGYVKSCGCINKEHINKKSVEIGKTYNRLTVIEFSHNDKNNKKIYKCRCECSNIVYATSANIKNGVVKSCGCLFLEMLYERKGEKHPNWKGGISYEPYCVLFNNEFKKRVRDFWNNTCVECGKTKEEEGANLCVHHVNFDKESCCNDSKPLFVTLCKSCHSKTNANREYWEEKYTALINEKYGGQCYLPKS